MRREEGKIVVLCFPHFPFPFLSLSLPLFKIKYTLLSLKYIQVHSNITWRSRYFEPLPPFTFTSRGPRPPRGRERPPRSDFGAGTLPSESGRKFIGLYYVPHRLRGRQRPSEVVLRVGAEKSLSGPEKSPSEDALLVRQRPSAAAVRSVPRPSRGRPEAARLWS